MQRSTCLPPAGQRHTWRTQALPAASALQVTRRCRPVLQVAACARQALPCTARRPLTRCRRAVAGRASRQLTVTTRAMVNVDFASPSLVLGAVLIGAGVLLLQMRNMQTRVSRDADIVVAAMISIVGSTLIFQGWRLDPLLLLCQALTTSVAVWYGIETFRLRSKEEELEAQQGQLPPPQSGAAPSTAAQQQQQGTPLPGAMYPPNQQPQQLPAQQAMPEWMNVFSGVAQPPQQTLYPMQPPQLPTDQAQPAPGGYLPPAESQPYPWVQPEPYMTAQPVDANMDSQYYRGGVQQPQAPWQYGPGPQGGVSGPVYGAQGQYGAAQQPQAQQPWGVQNGGVYMPGVPAQEYATYSAPGDMPPGPSVPSAPGYGYPGAPVQAAYTDSVPQTGYQDTPQDPMGQAAGASGLGYAEAGGYGGYQGQPGAQYGAEQGVNGGAVVQSSPEPVGAQGVRSQQLAPSTIPIARRVMERVDDWE